MLTHPTLRLLTRLGLTGMAVAFTSLADNEEVQGLAHAEWLALLLDQEATWRNNRRLTLRLRKAKLRHHAVPEDIDYRAPVASTAACSTCCSRETGSKTMRIAPLSGQPASGKAGLAVRSATRPAGTTTLCFTPGYRA